MDVDLDLDALSCVIFDEPLFPSKLFSCIQASRLQLKHSIPFILSVLFRLPQDIQDILQKLSNTSSFERRNGLVSLQAYLRSGRQLSYVMIMIMIMYPFSFSILFVLFVSSLRLWHSTCTYIYLNGFVYFKIFIFV